MCMAWVLCNAGAYAMWSVSNPPCLQAMSDAIVRATSQYIVPNQPVPDWVFGIGNTTLRHEKIGECVRFFSFVVL